MRCVLADLPKGILQFRDTLWVKHFMGTCGGRESPARAQEMPLKSQGEPPVFPGWNGGTAAARLHPGVYVLPGTTS